MKKVMNSAVCLLERAAEKYGDKIAFEDNDMKVSFSELRGRGRAIAGALHSRVETGRTNPIIVYMRKSVKCVISFMGIMYTGSPFVPVNYEVPRTRFEKMIQTLGPAAIITDEMGAEKLAAMAIDTPILIFDELANEEITDTGIADAVLDTACDLDPAYIMFTSGSTGVPKGVTISSRGVIDYAAWIAQSLKVDENDILGLNSPFHFDNCIFDIYIALYTGASVVIIPEVLFMYPDNLMEYVADKEISCIFWVPTVMINVANSGILSKVPLPKLKKINFAGEVMPNRQLNIWRKALPDAVYANLYGPTEITVDCTYYVVDRDFADSDPLPIGKSCENMRVIILTEDNKLAEANEQGEICVIGSGVGLGYWNAPELTEKVFVQNPLNPYYNEKMYRTGDLGYVSDDGLIMYVGRKDNQIKLKGNRIELGEIENAAMCIDGVNGACAVFDAQNQRIVLFIESSMDFKLRLVNKELKKYVPPYMVPGELVVLDKLPHTANDKIDRVTLKKTVSEWEKK